MVKDVPDMAPSTGTEETTGDEEFHGPDKVRPPGRVIVHVLAPWSISSCHPCATLTAFPQVPETQARPSVATSKVPACCAST